MAVLLSGLGVLFFFALSLLLTPSAQHLQACAAALSLYAYFLIGYHFVIKNANTLEERALFNSWLWQRRHWSLYLFSALMICSGSAEIIYLSQFGSLDSLVEKYGIYFSSAGVTEWWRYPIGIFIHDSPMHWICNFFMGLIAIGIASAIDDGAACWHFLVLSIISVIAVQALRMGSHTDAIVGNSGGIFGVLGWLSAYSFQHRARLPKYLWLTLFAFSGANIALASAMLPHASQTAHISGFVAGILLALGYKKIQLKH